MAARGKGAAAGGNPTTSDTFADRLRRFRQGLKETGFVEGEKVAVVYRWAENQMDRLPELGTGRAPVSTPEVGILAPGPKLLLEE